MYWEVTFYAGTSLFLKEMLSEEFEDRSAVHEWWKENRPGMTFVTAEKKGL
jgi:hypothetical protein